MAEWFYKQSHLVQVVLLLIPFVNWVTELCVRWSAFLKTKSIITLVTAIVVTFGGLFIGWLDAVWCLVFNHLILAKA